MEDAKKAIESIKEKGKQKDLLNDQEGKMINNLSNRAKLLESGIISKEMEASISGPIDPEKHKAIFNEAMDHISSGDCRHCIKLVARHERNDTEFPLDGVIINQYTEHANHTLEAATKILELSEQKLEKAEKLNDDTKQMLEQPFDRYTTEHRRYLKWSIGSGGVVGFVIFIALAIIEYFTNF